MSDSIDAEAKARPRPGEPLSPEALAALRARVEAIPITSTLELALVEASVGRCVITAPYDRRYDGVFESFHGGLLMTVADSVACFAIFTQVGADAVVTTTDMNIRFLAPCLTDLRAEARVIKAGRTLCPVTVDLFDTHGTLVAVAQVTYLRLPKMPAR